MTNEEELDKIINARRLYNPSVDTQCEILDKQMRKLAEICKLQEERIKILEYHLKQIKGEL